MKLYKYGIEIFNGAYKEYGGHWRWMFELTGRWVSELAIGVSADIKFGHFCTFYDWYHHAIWLGFVYIAWDGWPLKETVNTRNEEKQ